MANANIATIAITNTFDEWRTRTNDLITDRNILRNQSYVKDNSNFTIANGAMVISRAGGGTLLTITGGDATVGGTVTTVDLIVGDDASVANQLSVTGNTIVTGNLSVGTNSTFSQNVSITGFVTSDLKVAGNTTLQSNLSVSKNVTVSQNATVTGTANVTGDFKVGADRLTVKASDGNTAIAGTLSVTGAATVGGTLGVTGNTALSSNLAVTGNATVSQNATVTGTLNSGAATLASLGVTGAATVGTTLGVTGNTALSSNLAVTNNVTVSQNATISGTLTATGNVTGGNLSTANKVLGSTLESTVATGTAPLTVASTTKVTNLNADLLDGYDSSGSATPATIALRTGDGSLLANLLYGTLATAAQPNVTSLGTLSTLGVTGNTTLSSNLSVASNTVLSQNLTVTGTANLNGRTTATNLILDNTGTYLVNQGNAVFNNVTINGTQVNQGTILNDSDLIVLRSSTITDGNATLRSRRAGLGNAEIRFLSTSGVWQATANANLSYQTIITTQNLSTSVSSTSTVDAATPSAVKSAYDAAVAGFAQANSAANTVRVSGNSVSTLHAVSLNFTNTAFINVAVTSGVAGNANVAFFANTTASQGLVGAQGAQGFQGATGVQGLTGAQGPAGFQGAQGFNGTNGTQGAVGAQGAQGFQGATGGGGSAGAQGPQGFQGATGGGGAAGAQGPQGFQGATGGGGSAGAQGAQGFQGATGGGGAAGAQGPQGFQGAQGTTGTANSATQHFFIAGIGVGTQASLASNEIKAVGEISSFVSDMRLKNYLGQIEDALLKINGIQGFYYTVNEEGAKFGYDSTVKHVGVSAQDVEKVLPEVIRPAPADANYKTLDYSKIVPLLIEAIKELDKKVDSIRENLRKV